VSGAIVKKPGDDPQILLNRADHPNRQRFTAAHELGHYVHRAEDEPEGYEYIDFRGPLAGEGSDPKERFANAFAASLLMPEAEVRTRAKRARSIVELAYEFRVSQEAMTLRLKNLDVDVT
jgi:Zn-dependent peptidase ImmA (M78 family)